ncbi:MAG: pyridoxal phosphate-dependent aminotransferase [Thermodesulfobacteriota bacterium]|jgi:aspartate aminotransferase|nr:pyridoxal phosphate-dependent aminotransferase [Candidatus Dadabacteria bacterium]
MELSKLARELKPSATLAITAKAKEMKSQGIDVIGFGAGEPDFDTPENIKEFAKRSIDNGFTKYTAASGIDELKNAIISRIKEDYNVEYEKKEIFVGSGAKHVLYNLFQVLLDLNDEVIIPAPYWVSYPEQVRIAGGKPVILTTEQSNGFKVKPSEIQNIITDKTKILVLNYPSNPTGVTFTKEELVEIADLAEKNDLIIISDEIYDKTLYSETKHTSFVQINDSIKNRTILVNGVSKTYSMTGWRIGYAAGNKKVLAAMNNLAGQSTSNPTSIAQKASVEAFSGPQDKVNEMVVEFKKRRDFICKELNNINGISCLIPDGAFYVFPDISYYFGKEYKNGKIENSVDFSAFLLNEAKVAVVPGIEFGSDKNIRISYATSMHDIKEGVKRIKEKLEEFFS